MIAGGASIPVLIIGCGAIAGGFDMDAEDRDLIRTHAGAYARHPGFHVAACVDPDAERRATFMARWGIPVGYHDLEICLAEGPSFEVASICSDTASHAGLLDRLLETGIRAAFCEKPLSDEIAESRRLVKRFEERGVLLAINYLRRGDDDLRGLAAALEAGKWGGIQVVVGYYGKGLLHNGSHLIDLLDMLFGRVEPTGVLDRLDDGRNADPTLTVHLRTATGVPVLLVATGHSHYHLFEMTITTDRGQIALERGGTILRERRVGPHPHFPANMTLTEEDRRDTRQGKALYRLVDNLHGALVDGGRLLCSGRHALQAHEVCAKLVAMYEEQSEAIQWQN